MVTAFRHAEERSISTQFEQLQLIILIKLKQTYVIKVSFRANDVFKSLMNC
jgi:hypothetical protein